MLCQRVYDLCDGRADLQQKKSTQGYSFIYPFLAQTDSSYSY